MSEAAATLTVPADSRYVATLRLTAASLATQAGLTVDTIEDLRLAVDEAATLLMPHAAPGAMLETTFDVGPGRLAADLHVRAGADDARLDRTGYAWTLLRALAGEVQVTAKDGTLGITVVMHRATPA